MFGFFVVVLYKVPSIQITLLAILNISTIAFLIVKQPYKSRTRNVINIIVEILMFITLCMIFKFVKNNDENEKSRINFSWILIALFFSLILFHFIGNIIIAIKYNLINKKKKMTLIRPNLKNMTVKVKSSVEFF